MDHPCPRFAHSAVCISGKLLVWGGKTANKLNIPASNMEILSCCSGEWEIVHIRGTPPYAVWRSATIVVGTRVFNFGGLGDIIGLGSNDLHELDLSKMEWKIKTSSPSNGPAQKGSCGIVQRGDNELVVIGGEVDGNIEQCTNEVHCIQLSEGECVNISVLRVFDAVIVLQPVYLVLTVISSLLSTYCNFSYSTNTKLKYRVMAMASSWILHSFFADAT